MVSLTSPGYPCGLGKGSWLGWTKSSVQKSQIIGSSL